jgi:hypothetical protein
MEISDPIIVILPITNIGSLFYIGSQEKKHLEENKQDK